MNYPASKSVHKQLASLLNMKFDFVEPKGQNRNIVDGQPLESSFEDETNYPTSKSVHKQLAYLLNRRFDFVDPTRKGQTPNLNLVDQEGKEKPLESSFDKNYESQSDCLDPKLELKSNKGMECFSTQMETSNMNGFLTNTTWDRKMLIQPDINSKDICHVAELMENNVLDDLTFDFADQTFKGQTATLFDGQWFNIWLSRSGGSRGEKTPLESSFDKNYQPKSALVDSNKRMECLSTQKEISDRNRVLMNLSVDHDMPIQKDFNSNDTCKIAECRGT